MTDRRRHGLTGGARRPQLLALEPRMMFDAAMAATTEAVAASRPSDGGDHPGGETDARPYTPEDINRPNVPDALRDAVLPEHGDLRAQAPADDATAREIIFIDTAVADYRQLADAWAGRGEVVLIDARADGIDQVRAALAGRGDVGAIHIVSHGEAGVLFLGTTRIDAASIDGELAGSLAAIGRSLSTDGDILLYGCDFAEGSAGARALERFAAATGADVAASTDTTGAAVRSGDWDLEARRGLVEAAGLDGGNWVHTLDPNVPVPISVAVGSLTVRNGDGTVVFAGSLNNYNNNAARSPDVAVGAVATWANAATYQGRSVDLRATVTSITAGDAVQFNRVTGTGTGPDDPTFLLRDLTNDGKGATVELKWELLDHVTGAALPANVRFTIADIDGIDGAPHSRETVSASTDHLAYYTRERTSDIHFTSSLDRIEASGTRDENNPVGATLTPQSAATFDWSDVSAFTLTYTLAPNSVTTQAQFYHDGDADFVYTDPVYVSVPRLDLDGDDGTAAGNDAHFTYTENDLGIGVVDADVRVINPMPSEGIVGGRVVLTNAKPGDVLAVGALPDGITATTATDGGGRITVTFSGNGSEADYAAAFRAVTFRNTTDTPDPAQRVIEVSFSNDTLTTAVATSRIDVNPVSDAPVAAPDRVTTAEDTAVTVAVLANDSDPDGDPLTVTAATVSHGRVAINADGTLTYTPDADFNGTDTIRYTVGDGHGGTASTTVDVTVTPVNDAPVATSIPRDFVLPDGARVRVLVVDAFADVDGDALSYAVTGLPAGLTIDAATGVISGTIDRSASQANGGRYAIRLTATDPGGLRAVQDVTLTVTNPPPVAVDDGPVTTPEDQPITIAVLANDSDPDGDPLTVTSAAAGHGRVAINADGTLTYTPDTDFNGTDTIRYTISDGQGGTASAQVDVGVTPVNDAPVPVGTLPDRAGVDGSAVSIDTAGSFRDVDGDRLVYSASGLPAGLTIDAATGVISGTIDRSASQTGGGIYAIVVTVGDGQATATQPFRLTVTNPPPVAVDDGPVTTPEDQPITIAVLANDSDPDGDPLTVTSAAAGHGRVAINADGTLTYTPDADFNGTDTIRYTISDGQGGTASAQVDVGVTPVNDAPVPVGTPATLAGRDGGALRYATGGYFADADGDALTYGTTGLPAGLTIDAATGVISGTIDRSASQANGGRYDIVVTARDPSGATATQRIVGTIDNPPPVAVDDGPVITPEDQPITIAVLANDSDPDGDPLTVTSAAAGHGRVAINADGTLTYTPDTDFNGTDTIRYTISDGQGGTASAAIDVAVTPVDDAPAPTGVATTYALVDGASVTGLAAGSFADPDGDRLTYVATGLPAGLSIDPATGAIAGVVDRSASQANGGRYTVRVTATDPGGLATSRELVLTVANPAPVAVDDQATTAEDTPVTLRPIGNDRDLDGDPLILVAADADHGRVTINVDGTLTYVPDADFNGEDTLRYTISDGQGGTASATITVSVTPGDDAPDASPLTARVDADASTVAVSVAAAFTDRDGDALTYAATGLPAGLSIDPRTGLVSGTIVAGGAYGGPAADGRYPVVVTATDRSGLSATSGFTWTVAPVAPVARPDAYATPEDTPLTMPVLANDSDGDGDPLVIVAASATNGSVAIVGDRLVFTPASDFEGTATVTYTIADPAGNRSTATATVTVTPANDAPAATPSPATTARDGQPVSLDLGRFFADVDGDRLRYAATGLPPGLSIDPDTGRVAGTLPADASRNAPYQVVVTATDPSGATGSAGFAWTIVNPAPVAVDDRATTAEDRSVTIDILANDADPDGDAIAPLAATALHGRVEINADGTLTYTPDADFNGDDVVTYTIRDADGARAAASVFVTVTPVADAPVATAVPMPSAAAEGERVSIDGGALFRDADGDTLRYAATGLPPGLAIDPATGAITGTVAPGTRGTGDGVYRATVTATDPSGASASTTVEFRILDRPPALVGDPAALAQVAPEGQAVTIAAGALFADPDAGDTLVFSASGLPAGLLIDPATGTVTGTPARGDAAARPGGLYPVVVTATDRAGAAVSATIPLTIVNRPPVAGDDYATTSEDGAVTIPVLANDRDPGGDPLSVVAAAADHGTVTINADGTLAYRPGADFAGTDLIRYTVSDGQGGTAEALVRVTVTPVNDAPVVPSRGVPVDAVGGRPLVIDGLAGASDVDGDALRITGATAAVGTVAIGPEGRLVYAPPLGFAGTTSITYTVADGRGGTATATILVRVADGRGADVCQLLRIGRVSFPDPARAAVSVPAGGEMRNPLAVGLAVDGIRSLRGTGIGGRPVIDAVDAIRDLRGTGIDDAQPIAGEVQRLGRMVDFRDAGDRLFDQRWGDFLVKGLTGFSAAADGHACVMVESVVRGGAIYLEVRDTATDGRAAIRSVDVFPARGGHRPEWLRVDRRGLAIVERGAGTDELHLVVRVTRENGRITTTRIVVQGATGEVELERAHARPPTHAPLHAAIQTPAQTRAVAAARLAASFE